jgi:two-component system, OmpR family, KDP operon response regulator KdpE
MDELVARIRVALRSPGPAEESPVVETANFSIDLAKKQVRRGDVEVRVTATEWRLLELLVRNPGRLLTYHYVLERVWESEGCEEAELHPRLHGEHTPQARIRPLAPEVLHYGDRLGLRFHPEGDEVSPT